MSDKQMFDQVYCSQCGGSFGPGYHGYSHCSDHTESALVAQQKADDIHTCSYYCTRPACIKAQRDELRDKMEAQQKAEPVALNNYVQPVPDHCDRITWRGRYFHLPIAATPIDPEGIRLLLEALDWVGLDSPMFEKIDAYLAKQRMYSE